MAVGSLSTKSKGEFRRENIGVAAELAGPNPTPIEATLAQTAALCWFALRTAEAQYAAYMKSGDVRIALAEFRQRRIDHAHRRHLVVLRTLATVRRLALPTVQVNFARQQVNVAGAKAGALPDANGSGDRKLLPPAS